MPPSFCCSAQLNFGEGKRKVVISLGGISFSEKLDRILAPFAFLKDEAKGRETEPMELRGSLVLNHDVQLLATDYLLQMVIIRVTTEGSC